MSVETRLLSSARSHTARVTAPLRGNRPFAFYFAAGQVSSIGTAMATGAVAYAILQAGGGAGDMAVVFLGQMLATVVMLPIGGTLADRIPRVPLVAAVQYAVGALVGFQALLIYRGHAGAVAFGVIAALVAVSSAFSTPARSALVAAMVPAEQRQQAHGLTRIGHYAAITCGPVVGGLLVASAGPALGVGLNAVSFLLSGLLAGRIAVKAAPVKERSRFTADLAEGWRYAAGTPWLWMTVGGSSLLVAFWTTSYGIVGVTYVQRHLGGAAAWGWVAGSLGFGMIVGSVVGLAWRMRRAGWINCLSSLPMAAPSLVMSTGAPLPAVMAAVAFAAAGMSMGSIAWKTATSQLVPLAQQGRVSAWATMGELGTAPVLYLLVPALTGALGLRGTLALCGWGMVLASVAPLLHTDVRALQCRPLPRADQCTDRKRSPGGSPTAALNSLPLQPEGSTQR